MSFDMHATYILESFLYQLPNFGHISKNEKKNCLKNHGSRWLTYFVTGSAASKYKENNLNK